MDKRGLLTARTAAERFQERVAAIQQVPTLSETENSFGPKPLGDPDCSICHGQGYYSLDVPVGDRNFGRAFPCECRSEEIAVQQVERMKELADLKPREIAITLDDLVDRGAGSRAMIAAVREFATRPYGFLTLWGEVGTGKTTAAIALVNYWRSLDTASVVYVHLKDLVDWVRQGNATGATHDAVYRLRLIRSVKYLVIEEVDKLLHITDFAHEFWTALVGERNRLAQETDPAVKCHTVFVMNKNPNQLPEYIYDRLRWGAGVPGDPNKPPQPGGFRIIHNTDKSARPSGL